jgi:single-strand DNA-binding protein
MAGVNKVILVGNLGKDPEVRYLDNNKVVANLTLATTENYKDRNGNKVENTEWHDLELWDGLAKIAEQYLVKGKSIYVEGKIKTDSWKDNEGNNKYRTRIRVQNMTMLGGGTGTVGIAPEQRKHIETPDSEGPTSNLDMETDSDDLPF